MLSAIAVTVVTVNRNDVIAQELFSDTNALADNESGTNVICRCSMSMRQNCAVNNWGGVCASGYNVQCWNYNLNCN